MTKELAIRILRGEVLGTNEQTHEAVFMAIRSLKAEAEPTKHGRWIVISEYPKKAECSHCGYPIEHELVCWWDYCPNCGARMSNDSQIKERSICKGFDGLTAEKVNGNQIKMEPEEQFRDFASRYGTAGMEDGGEE